MVTARTALGVALFVVLLGAPDGALGVVWPSLRSELDRPTGDLGLLPLIATVPYLLASATAARAMRRITPGRYIAAAAIVGTAGLALWAGADAWAVVLASFVLQGWACGALDASLNAQVAAEHGIGKLGLLHASYGVGATGGPALATALLVSGAGWRWAVGVFAAATALTAIAAIAVRTTWPPVPTKAEVRQADAAPTPVVVTTLALFFLYVALEAAVGVWAFTFLTRVRDMSDAAAGTWTSVYWAALTAGRFALAAVGDRVDPDRMLQAGAVLGFVGTVVLWLDPAGVGAVGLAIAGLGFSAIFPVLIGVTPGRVGEQRGATVIGWSIGAAAIGGPTGILAVGQLGERAGLARMAPAFVALAVVVVAVNAALTARASSSWSSTR